ncbi:DUF5987 family protein [Actinosynnema sp. NPDC050436]|uniref:DUF5987 family protein n=1 Tax=Actinosynnema sp. NPDC050436 TaxID=3155659 RepID=UPI0033C5DC0E
MHSDTAADRAVRTLTLEAFADTIVPGAKRSPEDRAVAGAAPGGGAVDAGAVALLETPAAGVVDGLDSLSLLLNQHARDYAARLGTALDPDVPPFVALPFAQRTGLVAELVAPGHPEKDGWVALALFSNMAFDTGAHLHTTEAMAAGHPGLRAMGFAEPDADGLWRFPAYSYRRELARTHPGTTPAGDPS